jgi:hypothetical protein
MSEMINQVLHGGVVVLAVIAFLIFYLTQIWKSVHEEASYGEKIISVKQPKNEWLTLVFILAVGVVVVIRLFMEKNTPDEAMPDSYGTVLIGAIILIIGLLIFLAVRTICPTKIFTNGILVHDYGYVAWTDIRSVDKLPKGQFKADLIKPKQFKGKTMLIRYDASQEDELIRVIQQYIR